MNVFDERQAAAQKARGRHRERYWQAHDREDYECPDCGDGLEDVEQFEVHHIDGDPFNGDPENLVALCRRCHRIRHGHQPPRTIADWQEDFRALGSTS